MARRMYDLDNGTENIKVKEIVADKITAGSGAVTINGSVHIDIGEETLMSMDGVSLEVGNNDEVLSATNFFTNSFSIYTENAGSLTFGDTGLEVEAPSCFYEDVVLKKSLYMGKFTTALRPTANEGGIIYDSTLKKCILWNGTAWVNLDGTSLGE